MKKLLSATILLSMTVALMAQEASTPKRYEIKSGIVKTVTTVMGQKTEVTSYFDNFGALESAKTKTAIPGMGEMEIATIQKDGKTYMVNYTAKQVQQLPTQDNMSYLNLTNEIVKKYKIQELGKETLGERECTKYQSEISQNGQIAKVTTWVWKGIAVKSVTAIAGIEIVAEVVELTEDAYILPQTFEVPTF